MGNEKKTIEETTEELAGILAAISIVSKRLAKNLLELQQRKGAEPDGQE